MYKEYSKRRQIHHRESNRDVKKKRNLKLALGGLILENSCIPRIGVEDEVVNGVLLAGTTEQIFVNLSVRTAQAAVKLPVGNSPSIDKADSVRTDLIKKLHDGSGAGEGDLADSHGAGREELGGFALESVKRVETEESVEEGLGVRINGLGKVGLRDSLEEVPHNQILGVSSGQTPEVNQKAVPRALLSITVLQGLESEMGGTPGESLDNISIILENIERSTLLAAVKVVA